MATAAAAIVAKARREVDDLFWTSDAFSPERALEFQPRNDIQARYLEQLIAEGIVHEVQPGRYWFDLDAYRELRRQKLVWGIRLLVMGAVVFLVVFLVQYFRR